MICDILQIVTEYQGNVADTMGYYYYTLSDLDQGTVIHCVVEHTDTATTLRDNVTMGKLACGLIASIFAEAMHSVGVL